MVNMNSIEILAGHKCFDLLLTDCIGDSVGSLLSDYLSLLSDYLRLSDAEYYLLTDLYVYIFIYFYLFFIHI